MSAPTPLVRSAVYRRDGGQCASCATIEGLSFQHRRAVGMGGSRTRPGAADGLTLCLQCNQECEGSLQSLALVYGWKVRKWADPVRVPVYFRHQWQWFLFEGAERRPISGVTALDAMHSVYGDQYLTWSEEL